MRIIYVSDNVYDRGPDGGWYNTAAFPLKYISEALPELRSFCFWGRLRERTDVNGVLRLDNALPSSTVRIEFDGPFGQKAGPLGYASGILKTILRLRQRVRNADILWAKMPYVYSTLAWPFAGRNQLRISHQVGNAAECVGQVYPRMRFLGHFLDWSSRRLASKADIAAFVSEKLRDKYGDRSDAAAMVVHNSRITRDMLWRRPRTMHSPFRLLFVGRISPEKGLAYAIEALAQTEHTELCVVGEGPVKQASQRRAEELGIADRVTWRGRLRWGLPLFSAMRDSDALILPSLTEGLPQVVVEAQTQSCPVIATTVGGIPEIIRTGENGILVPPGDSTAIAEAIRQVRDPATWQRLSEGAAEEGEKHTVEKQTGKLLERIQTWWRQKGRCSGR